MRAVLDSCQLFSL